MAIPSSSSTWTLAGAEIVIKALDKQLVEGRTVTAIVTNAASFVVHQ